MTQYDPVYPSLPPGITHDKLGSARRVLTELDATRDTADDRRGWIATILTENAWDTKDLLLATGWLAREMTWAAGLNGDAAEELISDAVRPDVQLAATEFITSVAFQAGAPQLAAAQKMIEVFGDAHAVDAAARAWAVVYRHKGAE